MALCNTNQAARTRHRPALITLLVALSGTSLPLASAQVAEPQAQPAAAAPGTSEKTDPADPPPLASSVAALLKASYLTDAERAAKRVFHGQWTDDDLNTPALRAQAALIRGAYDDASLADPGTPSPDRAEAAILRGDFALALDTIGPQETDLDSLRIQRLRAEALEGLGRFDNALAAADLALAPTNNGSRPLESLSGTDVAELVRVWVLRTRLAGAGKNGDDAANEYRAVQGWLTHARNDLDKLAWPVRLAEAKLLISKDNRAQGGEAALEVLSLNPKCVEAWALAGELAVDGFNFEGAESIAARIEEIAAGVTIESASILARARLRVSDPDGAELVLAPALEKFPRSPRLLALSAATAALRYDDGATRSRLEQLDGVSPKTPDGYAAVGSALAEARQYDLAPPYLNEAIKRGPNRPEPLIDLGLMALQAGRDLESIDTLTKAQALDPFHARADNTLKLAKMLMGYERAESDHFVVRYSGAGDALLAKEMLPLLEVMHARVCGRAAGGIDHEPATKTVIDLMPDSRSFAVRITGMTQIHTMAASTGPCIAMETPREGGGRRVGLYDWLRVVRHEYTHTVSLSRTKNRIPHWYTEAAAVYLEDSPRDTRTCRMLADALANDGLFAMDEISIKFVRPKKPIERSLAYAQGHWMYEFIILRNGPRAPLDLMDRYAAGDRQDAAFQKVLGTSEEAFLAEFKAWAHQRVIEWGLAPKPGQPTLEDLLTAELNSKPDAGNAKEGNANEGGDSPATPEDEPADAEAPDAEKQPDPDNPLAKLLSRRGPRLPQPTQEMVDRWLAQHPDNPWVLRAAIDLALKASKGEPTAELIPLLERYATACPVEDLPHRLLAKWYLDQKQGPQAIEHLEFLDQREQYTPIYAVELAKQYASAGDWPKATAKATRATIVGPFVASNRELAAAIAIQAKDLQTAKRHIAALTIIEPDRPQHQQRLEAIEKLLTPK